MITRSVMLVALFLWPLYAGTEALEGFFADAVDSDAPPSVSLAVLHGDELIYEKSFGVNDPDRKHPSTPESVYNLYSLTKIVTATVVMQLVQEGKVALDAPVRRYFPRFVTRYDGEDRNITVEQLLTHSAGVTDRSGDYRHLFDDTRDAALKSRGETPPAFYELDYEPGSEASYDNSSYIVLGYLVEKVSGRSFEEEVRERVLRPAGMTRTGFEVPEGIGGDEVFGTLRFFSWMGQAMRFMITDADKDRCDGTMLWLRRVDVPWSPAGGLKGSARDVARFLQAGSRLELYDAATRKTFMERPPVPVDTFLSKFDRVRFGIGWYHLEDAGTRFYQHQGIGPGFRNIMRIYPDEALSFVILTNQTGTDIDAWADRVFQAFSEETP